MTGKQRLKEIGSRLTTLREQPEYSRDQMTFFPDPLFFPLPLLLYHPRSNENRINGYVVLWVYIRGLVFFLTGFIDAFDKRNEVNLPEPQLVTILSRLLQRVTISRLIGETF